MKLNKIIVFQIVFLILSNNVFGYYKKDTTLIISNCDSLNLPIQIELNLPETIKTMDITPKENSKSILEKHAPWIAALLIGLLTAFINIYLANERRKLDEKNIKLQLENASRITNQQIENALRITNQQIENAKSLAIIQFKMTLKTKNEQDWLNLFIDSLTEFIACTASSTPDSKISKDVLDENHKKLFLTKSKIELLSNPQINEHSELLIAIDNIILEIIKSAIDFNLEDFQDSREKLIAYARKVVNLQMDNIKKLDI